MHLPCICILKLDEVHIWYNLINVVVKETLFPWQQEYSRIFCILQSGEVHIWYTRETKTHKLSGCNETLLPCHSLGDDCTNNCIELRINAADKA